MAERMMLAAKKRGRAYRCRHCPKLGRPDCIAEKGRMESHVFKHHVQLDRVPYSCSQCMFHCTSQEQFDRHLTNYAWHQQRGVEGGITKPLISPDPYVIGEDDIEQLGKEESWKHFLGRAKTPAASPEAPREEAVSPVEKSPQTELDILAEAAKEFVLDYTDEGMSPAGKVLVEVEVDTGEAQGDSGEVGVQEHDEQFTEVEEPFEEALDLRVVVQRETPSNEGQETAGKAVESASVEEFLEGAGNPSRKRQQSGSSESSSGSGSSDSSGESLRRSKDLMDTLAKLVKQSADLVNHSVDRVEGMVRGLADTLKGVAKKMDGLSDSLGKFRSSGGAEGSGDRKASEGVGPKIREYGDAQSSRRSRSKSRVRDGEAGKGASEDRRTKQSDRRDRSRSKSKGRDGTAAVSRREECRQRQSDRRDRSRSKSKARDGTAAVSRREECRQRQDDRRDRSRSKSKVRDDTAGVSRREECRQRQSDRRDRSRSRDRNGRSRSRGRSGRRVDSEKGHREDRIGWRSRSRSVDRVRRDRDCGASKGGQRARSKDRGDQKHGCNERRDREVRQDEDRKETSRCNGGQRFGSRERDGGSRRDDREQRHEGSRRDGKRYGSRERDGDVRRDEVRRERSSESRDEDTRERWDRTRNERRN